MSEFSGGAGGEAGGFDSGLMDGGDGAQSMGGPSHSASWNNGIRGVKFSDMVQGINVTPNFMLAMLFLGFTAWLFVIYWIRHNEPLANKVLGTPQASAPTAFQDRMIVNGAKHALPIRTSDRTGNFYTPGKKEREELDRQRAIARQGFSYPSAQPSYDQHVINYAAPGASHAKVLKNDREHVVVPHPEPMVMAPQMHHHELRSLPNNHYMHPESAGVANPYYNKSSHYHLPITSGDGVKLKTVVNR